MCRSVMPTRASCVLPTTLSFYQTTEMSYAPTSSTGTCEIIREVTVNKGIQATLQSESGEDFWWFNNGVTILCSDAVIGADSTSP
jgi:hypothetical protein